MLTAPHTVSGGIPGSVSPSLIARIAAPFPLVVMACGLHQDPYRLDLPVLAIVIDRRFFHMKKLLSILLALCASVSALIPEVVLAGGGKAEMLVVVADTRRVSWGVTRFMLDLYNTDPFMFGLFTVVFTAALGCGLGLISDFIMQRTGIDLKSRKIVEH